jgi:REP element-mobilizing transposase RayT
MAQSLSSVLIHLVFSTKGREPLITEAVEPELHAYLGGILRDLKCPSLIVGGDVDHIHALFALSRTITIADVVEEVKSSSSKWIKTKGDEFAEFKWQAGYGAFSIGQSNIEALTHYIANQKAHHRGKTFQDEYRALCHKYRVEFDEQYVWD